MKFSATTRPNSSALDIIGDVHGHHGALVGLLTRLGYRRRAGVWRHPGGARSAVFVGDLIDRGPAIRAVVDDVYEMCRGRSARIVCGNHEYNAILWHTRGADGHPLRRHTDARRLQHEATLSAYEGRPSEWQAALRWFRSLPLVLESAGMRVVHAAWRPEAIAALGGQVAPLADDRVLERSARPGTPEHRAVEELLKGVETALPDGTRYVDKDGVRRSTTRLRWWQAPPDRGVVPVAAVAMPPADRLPSEVTLPVAGLPPLETYADPRPVFTGHYWLTPPAQPLSDRVACLDYSVAAGGLLCAYRWDGTVPLSADRFSCVHPDGTPAP